MRHIRFIAGLVAGITLAGGVALAAIPNSITSDFSACANKTTGALRVIDAQAGKKCTAAERLITWQQRVTSPGLDAAGGSKVSCVASQRWSLPNCKPVSFRTGSAPSAMAFDGLNVWALNSGANTVTRYNTSTGVAGTVVVGTHPNAAAFDGTSLWVTNLDSNSISRINVTSNAVSTISTGAGTKPTGIVFDGTAMWVSLAGAQSVRRYATTGAALGTVTVASTPNVQPYDLAFDGRFLYAVANDAAAPTSQHISEVIRIDPLTQAVQRNSIPIEGHYAHLTLGPTMIYVADPYVGVVAFIELSTLEVSNSFIMHLDSHPSGIAFDGGSLWVAEPDAHAIARIDQLGYVHELPIAAAGALPTGVMFDGSNMWVSNGGTNTVQRYTP
jgi:YVTN family beta-propeller protein